MEIYAFDWSFMSLVDLNHMLRPQVVKLDLLIMRARGNAIPKRVKLHLMDHTRMFLIGLYRFFGVEIPDVDKFIIA